MDNQSVLISQNDSKYSFRLFYKGAREGSTERVNMLHKASRETLHLPNQDIFISLRYTTNKIFLKQQDTIIEDFDTGYSLSRQYSRSILKKGNSVLYSRSAKKLVFIPHLLFRPLSEQEASYIITAKVTSKIAGFEILDSGKIVVVGTKGFVGVYSTTGAVLGSHRVQMSPKKGVSGLVSLSSKQKDEIEKKSLSRATCLTAQSMLEGAVTRLAVCFRTLKGKNKVKQFEISKNNKIDFLNDFEITGDELEVEGVTAGGKKIVENPIYALKSLKVEKSGNWILAGLRGEDNPITFIVFALSDVQMGDEAKDGSEAIFGENSAGVILGVEKGVSFPSYHLESFVDEEGDAESAFLVSGAKKGVSLFQVRFNKFK